MRSCVSALSLIALVLAIEQAPGVVVRVPSDYPTIQEGVDAASPGDTVLVAPGTYAGEMNVELTFDGKPIRLASEDGAEATFIECGWHERGMIFTGTDEDSTLTVSGFTVHGVLHSYELVITQEGASPVLEHCVFSSDYYYSVSTLAESCPTFRDCVFTSHSRGVSCDESSGPRFFSCEFRDCGSSAVYCKVLDPPYPFFSNCLFEENGTSSDIGGAVRFRSSARGGRSGVASLWGGGPRDQIRFENCTFLRNQAAAYGGAFCCIEAAPPEIVLDSCTFIGNEAGAGGALYNIFGTVTLTNSLVLGNSAPQGGAIFATTGLSVVGCTIVANAGSQSSGIHIPPAGTGVRVERSIIALGIDGPAVECGSGDVSFEHCVVFDNAGGDDVCGNPDNIVGDPLFCDAGADDFTLCGDSICLPGGNVWGELIGAFPQGCPPCGTAVEDVSWARIKALFGPAIGSRRPPN